ERLFHDEIDDAVHAFAGLQVREDEGPLIAHFRGVSGHHLERGADVRRQIRFVDDEQIRAGDTRAALAGDLVAGGDVDDVERQVAEIGAEGRREVVAAALHEHQVQIGKAPGQLGDGVQVR